MAEVPLEITWTRTCSGEAVDLVEPIPADIRIEDFAAALSKFCRRHEFDRLARLAVDSSMIPAGVDHPRLKPVAVERAMIDRRAVLLGKSVSEHARRYLGRCRVYREEAAKKK